jgi:endonuclease/exonuclease/phosphatase family metal-dependent hydrolase
VVPTRAIDYILVRCDAHGPILAVTACASLFDRPVNEIWASDHFGVVADLAVATTTNSQPG